MRNFIVNRVFRPRNRYSGPEKRYSKSSLYLVGGMVLVFASGWVVGCSSSPQSPPNPTKQEVQTDSDRFFKNLEKEEEKKDEKEAKP